MKSVFHFLFLSVVSQLCYAQSSILPLWPDVVPNHIPTDEKEVQNKDGILWITHVTMPSLEIFLPAKQHATGRGVIICPGGGYAGLAYDWEGTDIAKSLNAKGIAAFVLKYRLPSSPSIQISHLAPLQDAQRAIRLVRHHADEWNVNADQVGVMGFSAGGHLASTLGTHYAEHIYPVRDAIDSLNARPDFMILIYPVISMQAPVTHRGSRDNLLGMSPSVERVHAYSNERQVDVHTPPTFLLHAGDDDAVPVANSLLFYEALIKAGVKAEMHLYPEGGHGFSLAIGKDPLQSWPERLADWIEELP